MIRKEYHLVIDYSDGEPRESHLSNGDEVMSEQITGLKFDYE